MDEKKAPERIILGSGYIHLGVFTKGQQIPEPQDFCTDANRYSYIKMARRLNTQTRFRKRRTIWGECQRRLSFPRM